MKAAALLALAALAILVPASAAAPPPGDFVARVDNPWYPLTPGTTYVYAGVKDGRPLRVVTAVTHETALVAGVRCTVIHDRGYLSGRLAERTTDWYAQDRQGNVWYFGEATAELDAKGRVVSTEGSWRAGVGGARAGIYMPAHPRVGQSYAQEFSKGHAEDHFRVLALAASVTVPYTSSRGALLTEEWTPLERGVLDHKLYVRGIGMVKEQAVKGPPESAALVQVRRT
jgi:hypothetical protein